MAGEMATDAVKPMSDRLTIILPDDTQPESWKEFLLENCIGTIDYGDGYGAGYGTVRGGGEGCGSEGVINGGDGLGWGHGEVYGDGKGGGRSAGEDGV